MKDDRIYLLHIRECIEKINQYTVPGRAVFLANPLVQDAVLRNLQILAESCGRLSETLKAAHPDTDWRNIAGFRNVIVHDYLGIDVEQIWEIIAQNLPPLRKSIESMLASLGTPEPL